MKDTKNISNFEQVNDMSVQTEESSAATESSPPKIVSMEMEDFPKNKGKLSWSTLTNRQKAIFHANSYNIIASVY